MDEDPEDEEQEDDEEDEDVELSDNWDDVISGFVCSKSAAAKSSSVFKNKDLIITS